MHSSHSKLLAAHYSQNEPRRFSVEEKWDRLPAWHNTLKQNGNDITCWFGAGSSIQPTLMHRSPASGNNLAKPIILTPGNQTQDQTVFFFTKSGKGSSPFLFMAILSHQLQPGLPNYVPEHSTITSCILSLLKSSQKAAANLSPRWSIIFFFLNNCRLI